MTEAEWLGCTDPLEMLEFLRDDRQVHRRQRGRRKLRLFAVACCRRVSRLFRDDRGDIAMEMAERYSDRKASKEELDTLRDDLWIAATNQRWACAWNAIMEKNWEAAYATAINATYTLVYARGGRRREREKRERAEQCDLLRDIFGNPLCPVTVNPSMGVRAVVGLARTIYEERDFNGLTKLADVLEQAGCKNAEILQHCRQPREHVRGCWVLDLLLGKG